VLKHATASSLIVLLRALPCWLSPLPGHTIHCFRLRGSRLCSYYVQYR
jgi:hypothetical protein